MDWSMDIFKTRENNFSTFDYLIIYFTLENYSKYI